MPTGTTINSDLVIYDRLVQTAYLERIQDVLDIFNGASNGALVMRNESIEGDFDRQAFYDFQGSVVHRNVNATTTPDPNKIGADERVSVKTPWRYGPFQTTEEAFKRRKRTMEEFSMLIGQDMADAQMAYQIVAAFAALNGAIGSNTNMIVTGSFATDGKKVLTRGMRKFGDRFERIAIFAMHSDAYFDMVDDAIQEKVFEEAGLVIYGGSPGTMGKPILVSDRVPADAIYGLQPGAVVLTESQPPGFRSYNIDDQENLAVGYRAEGAFNIEVLGYTWDVDGSPAAPANPTTTELGTAANWAKSANSDKATAGVIIELTAS